jgi:murein DD-endopeptidase MepM/ murein hydrolase activator NlpD
LGYLFSAATERMKKKTSHLWPALLCALACAAAIAFAGWHGVAQGKGASAKAATALADRLGLGTRTAATLLLNGGFPDSWVEAAGGETPPKSLEWPLPGRRLGRGFDSEDGTRKHEAVDITAPEGTEIRAMAAGIVGYADDEVKGYGNLTLVLHSGGWVTLYAHQSKIGARPGQRVVTGEVLGLVGNTGISRGSHLHFALLIRGKAVDPMKRMHGAPNTALRVSWNDLLSPRALFASLTRS